MEEKSKARVGGTRKLGGVGIGKEEVKLEVSVSRIWKRRGLEERGWGDAGDGDRDGFLSYLQVKWRMWGRFGVALRKVGRERLRYGVWK